MLYTIKKNMNWNYRILKTPKGLSIYEVYYDEDGKPHSCAENPILDFHVESEEDIKEEIKIIKKAFESPTIDFKDFGKDF